MKTPGLQHCLQLETCLHLISLLSVIDYCSRILHLSLHYSSDLLFGISIIMLTFPFTFISMQLLIKNKLVIKVTRTWKETYIDYRQSPRPAESSELFLVSIKREWACSVDLCAIVWRSLKTLRCALIRQQREEHIQVWNAILNSSKASDSLRSVAEAQLKENTFWLLLNQLDINFIHGWINVEVNVPSIFWTDMWLPNTMLHLQKLYNGISEMPFVQIHWYRHVLQTSDKHRR